MARLYRSLSLRASLLIASHLCLSLLVWLSGIAFPKQVSLLLLDRCLSSLIPSLESWMMILTFAPLSIKLRASRSVMS